MLVIRTLTSDLSATGNCGFFSFSILKDTKEGEKSEKDWKIRADGDKGYQPGENENARRWSSSGRLPLKPACKLSVDRVWSGFGGLSIISWLKYPMLGEDLERIFLIFFSKKNIKKRSIKMSRLKRKFFFASGKWTNLAVGGRIACLVLSCLTVLWSVLFEGHPPSMTSLIDKQKIFAEEVGWGDTRLLLFFSLLPQPPSSLQTAQEIDQTRRRYCVRPGDGDHRILQGGVGCCCCLSATLQLWLHM